jgi:hypothetical protein
LTTANVEQISPALSLIAHTAAEFRSSPPSVYCNQQSSRVSPSPNQRFALLVLLVLAPVVLLGLTWHPLTAADATSAFIPSPTLYQTPSTSALLGRLVLRGRLVASFSSWRKQLLFSSISSSYAWRSRYLGTARNFVFGLSTVSLRRTTTARCAILLLSAPPKGNAIRT